MERGRLVEPFGQHLWPISTALSPIDVERLHRISSALYKSPTNCCKNHLERSTDPILYFLTPASLNTLVLRKTPIVRVLTVP
ncbi:hypothetical protein EKN09_13240 [Vibrio penaeicida]|nr:hypothetical protein EKN09_13240 [Vibrio penaeicida]